MRDRLQTLERRYTPASGGGAKESEAHGPGAGGPAALARLCGHFRGHVFRFEWQGACLIPKTAFSVYDLFSGAMADGQHGRYTESLEKLQEAEKVEPSSLPIRYLQALDYYRLKDFPQATDRFKSALELDPKFALATYYLGLTQLQTGDANAAASILSTRPGTRPHKFHRGL